MPVSVVCETAASVNAALRESLSSGSGGGSCSAAANKQSATNQQDENKQNGSSNNNADVDSLHGKLVASAKRVLLSKVDYEEVTNYGQSVLDNLKSKYIVLTPSGSNSMDNGSNSPATCNSNGANGDSAADGSGSNTSATSSGGGGTNAKKPNPNELPAPKRILYPRENVRIGWKATGRKWEVGVGMTNVGNTCYLNSTLQALFHVPSMANWLMSDTSHMERCESTDAGCIICAMAKTLQESQRSQSAIRPYYVYSKLKSICKHLVMGRQEDAHEFLRYLVEAMEKSYLSRFRNYKELDQYSKETTPLNQILGGYLRSAVRCLACNHVSVTFQHFQDLLLDIRKADTVDEALECYFSRERLEDMGYKCEACKKKVSATKQFSLERAPIALCIQLKRFSMLGTKLNKQIIIKPRLDLTKFASRKTPGEQLTYRLVAMVTHLGASQHCGHYTAIGLTESGTYYNYDDSYVRPISMQNVCNTNAYIIFYEMDTQPTRNITSTQVSGGAHAIIVPASTVTNQKDSAGPTLKVNGHVNSSVSQKIIGPQLPPGYNTNINGSSSSSLSNGGGSKLVLNRNSTSTSLASSSSNSTSSGGNSKIMIHFKNNNNCSSGINSSNLVKTSAATSSIPSASTTSTASSSTFDNLKNSNNNNIAHYNANGLHIVGTGKFQESAKHSLGLSTTKRQANNIKNTNESSSDDDDEDEIVSSSTSSHNATQATLPSMPKLCVESSAKTTSSSTLYAATTTTPTKNLANGVNKKSPAPVKSLVPYGSETDDENDVCMNTQATKAIVASTEQQKRLLPNPLKRRQSSSSWSNGSSSSPENEDDTNDRVVKPTTTNGIKIKKVASSSNYNNVISSKSPTKGFDPNKIASDTINEIFNTVKRSNNTNNSNIDNSTTSSSSLPLKKKLQNQHFTVTSSTTNNNNMADFSSSDTEDESNTKNPTSTRPPLKRSHFTPPSPPVVKTNSGIWQVTSLQPIAACVSPTAPTSSSSTNISSTQAAPEKTPKNLKNPFTKQPATLMTPENAKRIKKDTTANKPLASNGYQRNALNNESAISELLKQSHRGYGTPVLTWNGQQSEIDRENFYLFDEKRIEDDNLNNNDIIHKNGDVNNDHCHELNNDDDHCCQFQNDNHLCTNHNCINIMSIIVDNSEHEDMKPNITSTNTAQTNTNPKECDNMEDNNIRNVANETSISISPSYATDCDENVTSTENCLKNNDDEQLQQMFDYEMENIDFCSSDTTATTLANTYSPCSSLAPTPLPANVITFSTSITPAIATAKTFEFNDDDSLDNL